ncbi:hypothetical protein WME98_23670 [Sorangium sp. So ce296]|uniref:hypothetical protein n=1 Tax=Sorangium sp. So ce296 TaxID=3133296 RepID=UPI003F5DF79F
MPVTLVVILTVRCEALDAFRAYERKAAAVMARYGGAIERTVVTAPDSAGLSLKEIHIVTFPDEHAFSAYRRDGELGAVAHLRDASVLQTEILRGEEGPDYHAVSG